MALQLRHGVAEHWIEVVKNLLGILNPSYDSYQQQKKPWQISFAFQTCLS